MVGLRRAPERFARRTGLAVEANPVAANPVDRDVSRFPDACRAEEPRKRAAVVVDRAR